MNEKADTDHLVDLTADIAAAYVADNPVPAAELPAMISETGHGGLLRSKH